MAYPFEANPIPPQLDKRRKLTDEQRHEIKHLRASGWTYARIASEFEISATLANRVCNPEYAAAQDNIRRHKDYYDREKQVNLNRKTRARRKSLFDPTTKSWAAHPDTGGESDE